MNFTYLERQELNELSLEVFQSKSWWYNKLVKKGVKKSAEELAICAKPNVKYFTTAEEIKEYILKVKQTTEDMLMKMKVEAAKKHVMETHYDTFKKLAVHDTSVIS